MERNIVYLWAVHFTVFSITKNTVKNLKLIRDVLGFISQLTKILKIAGRIFENIDQFFDPEAGNHRVF